MCTTNKQQCGCLIHHSEWASEGKDKIIDRIAETFQSTEHYRCERYVYIKTSNRKVHADLLILKEDKPFAIAEIREYNYDEVRPFPRREAVEWMTQNASLVDAPYALICIPSEIIIIKNGVEYKSFKGEWTSLQIYNILIDETPLQWNDISTSWLEYLQDKTFKNKDKLEDYLKDDIDINTTESEFFLSTEAEMQFFKTILGDVSGELYRYTSMNSVFRICSESCHSMCGIECMNDNSEVDYVKSKYPQEYDRIQRSLNDENYQSFIISFCSSNNTEKLGCNELKDNLLMWRLYGDDAKGVCIHYQLSETNIQQNKNFYFAPISYAKDSKQSHPELEFLIHCLETPICGKYLKLNYFSIWQHFFKPYEYRNEQEVRLLHFVPKEKLSQPATSIKYRWIRCDTNGIITCIALFDIKEGATEFPGNIQEIIIGPNVQEAEINKQQLETLIDLSNIQNKDNIQVKCSTIDNYRG